VEIGLKNNQLIGKQLVGYRNPISHLKFI